MRQYDHDDEEMYTEQVYRVTNAMPERYPRSRVRPDELVMEDTLEEEFKSGFEAGGVDEHVAMERLPQRVRYLKLNTTVLPDLIVPYLYGDRQSRINAIMDQTGCTIDYCPLSPEEQGQSPQSMSYMMNFLVSAETVPQLEAACKMLRNVVDRVQFHVQQKLAVASSMRRRSGSIRHEAPERIEDEVEYLHGGVYGSFVKAEPIVYDQMPPREYPHRYHQEMLLDDNDFDMEPMWMENRRYTVPDPSRRFRPVRTVYRRVPVKAVEKLGSKSLPLGEVADSYGKSDLDAELDIPDAVGIWSTDAMKSEEEVKRAVKEENHLEIPVEAPSYVSPFFNDMVNESSTSVAMVGAQRRLLRELAKSDPYYYVRPLKLTKGPRSIGSSSCSFGCFGGSSTKWERKVVSQVSSRMKWFDSVAYSLAKVSGGKELLSRKKMNSTIRKLHLVALQLHCLLSHLYCVRKRLKCREIDSLPTALNNSYHEKRMNGYKSRLKLMVHQPQLHSNVPEELLRDTFEFFPELLLCVDMWGNDLRDGVAEKPSDVLSLKIPRDLLERARSRFFDFEGDKNGLLQSICEELLNILCLWNDFKWGESLESLTINAIVTFEERVKSSIRKILGIHSTHLLATWSEKILARPDLLYHIRMTQPNVYYSDTVPTGVFFQSGDKSVSLSSSNQHEEECEDSSESNDSWIPQDKTNDEPTSTVIFRLDDGLRPLRVHDLRSVAGKNLEQHVLKWSDVYNIRQQYQSLANNLGTFVRDSSTTESPSNILERIASSRNILNEAVQTSEKLALHSVGHQLPMELREGGEGGALADIESTDDSADEAERRQNENANLGGHLPTEKTEQPDAEMSPDVNEEETEPLDDQTDVKDLIEIVTSTNHDVTEICSQRSRSARVREKLQGQSVELARQSIQIFHNFLQASNRS
ncbi:hypothetical protein Poli38472_011875 [Pythium oligandrum]|uniref:Uncharacterized protein n=1 Tax=Pythium oligandrum TaxID=41045 RepID=A0A8K1C983_PYTOL|nr:hypothetical protein Poli38472_011875 [Pythium oligandrum]|eukprot:TMW58287.1 hypothetical protein Poli38472_011875 [Pythium oligandrum]